MNEYVLLALLGLSFNAGLIYYVVKLRK